MDVSMDWDRMLQMEHEASIELERLKELLQESPNDAKILKEINKIKSFFNQYFSGSIYKID